MNGISQKINSYFLLTPNSWWSHRVRRKVHTEPVEVWYSESIC
jgi:hypothetical protein